MLDNDGNRWSTWGCMVAREEMADAYLVGIDRFEC